MANTSSTEKILKARIQLIDNYTAPVKKAIQEAKKFERTTRNMKATLSVRDMATKTIKRVTSMAKGFAKANYKALVSVKDGASSVLNKLKSTMGILGAGVTIGVGVKMVAGGAMDLEEQKVSMSHFMGLGNKGKDSATINKMTNDYMAMLRNNANATPFETGEVVKAGTRALGLSGGNINEAMKLVKLSEDMASLTPGKTVSDAMEALADANMGEMERLKEFNYKGSSKDDPKKTIANLTKTFEGGAEKLSKTAKGKFSTSMGTLKSGLADFGTAFLPILSKVFDSTTNLLNKISPKMMQFSVKVADMFDKFSKSKEASVLIDAFKTVGTIAFNAIKDVIVSVSPTIKNIITWIIDNMPTIKKVLETVYSYWKLAWNWISIALDVAWKIAEPILDAIAVALDAISTAVKGVIDWWNKLLEKIKNPIKSGIDVAVNTTSNFMGANGQQKSATNKKNQKEARSRAFGATRVARDGDQYTLHQGEKVLTKAQANAYGKGVNGGVNINIANLTVREEADINKIAKAFVRELKITKQIYGGAC